MQTERRFLRLASYVLRRVTDRCFMNQRTKFVLDPGISETGLLHCDMETGAFVAVQFSNSYHPTRQNCSVASGLVGVHRALGQL